MKIIVVIPTYNERQNIQALIEAIQKEFSRISGHELGILVVDGHSPDGTAVAVRSLMAQYLNLYLIEEKEKRGVGLAYVEGMGYAVRQLGAEAIMEFDGDGQHDPRDIPRLIAELDRGYNYVIGSRYVAGGGVPRGWPLYRKLLSRLGGSYIRYCLRLPVRDTTSGFKLTRVKGFFDRLPMSEEKILSSRSAYKVHLLYAMIKLGAKVKEVPIQFLERQAGSSKNSLRDIWDTFRVTMTLFFSK